MSFTSFEFYVFFSIVLALYALLSHRWQNVLLLVASYFFYAYWNLQFTYLLMLTTVIDYWCGLKIGAAGPERSKKRYLALSLASNILILAVFKYGNFFIAQYNQVRGPGAPLIDLHIFFPIGISFYIFQSLAYTIDIYRGFTKPTRNFLEYALYVSFFPQLLAGPIERPRHMLPQIENKRTLSFENFKIGAHLIFWGLFQKLFVADSCAIIAERLLSDPLQRSGGEILVGMYVFAFQVFADIAGYTDIARGTAKCLGFDLAINFHLPYFSTNISNFWQRWHISLTGWFRDYVYFPILVATRGNAYLGSFVALFCIAIWHSLSFNSIMRGVYFGCIVVAYHLFKNLFHPAEGADNPCSPLRRVRLMFSALLTFHFVCIGWLFLLNERATAIPQILGRIFTDFQGATFGGNAALLARYIGPLLLMQVFQAIRKDELFILKTGFWVKVLFYWGVFLLLYNVSGGVLIRPFIYFHY